MVRPEGQLIALRDLLCALLYNGLLLARMQSNVLARIYLSTSFCFAFTVLFLSNLLAFLTSTASSRSRSFRARSLDDAASPSALKSICARPG